MQIQTNKESEQLKEYYKIKHELFWSVGLAIIGAAFGLGIFFGNYKLDQDKIKLIDSNKELIQAIKLKDNHIEIMRRNSDSAHNILAHMPYNEMTLDSLSFRKVQTTIENSGAALNLNKLSEQ